MEDAIDVKGKVASVTCLNCGMQIVVPLLGGYNEMDDVVNGYLQHVLSRHLSVVRDEETGKYLGKYTPTGELQQCLFCGGYAPKDGFRPCSSDGTTVLICETCHDRIFGPGGEPSDREGISIGEALCSPIAASRYGDQVKRKGIF